MSGNLEVADAPVRRIHYIEFVPDSIGQWLRQQILGVNLGNIALIITVIIISTNINNTLKEQEAQNALARQNLFDSQILYTSMKDLSSSLSRIRDDSLALNQTLTASSAIVTSQQFSDNIQFAVRYGANITNLQDQLRVAQSNSTRLDADVTTVKTQLSTPKLVVKCVMTGQAIDVSAGNSYDVVYNTCIENGFPTGSVVSTSPFVFKFPYSGHYHIQARVGFIYINSGAPVSAALGMYQTGSSGAFARSPSVFPPSASNAYASVALHDVFYATANLTVQFQMIPSSLVTVYASGTDAVTQMFIRYLD